MKKILLVEDEIDLAMTISARLEKAGYETVMAEDGISALDALSQEKFDLIIMDIMMPNMDGFAFAAILKSREDTKSLPIVVLTARTDDETKAACVSLGVAGYLLKPYEPDALMEKLEELLSNSKT